MKRREASRRRGPAARSRHTVLVYCGALRTEPDYFDGLKVSLRSGGVALKVRQEGVAPDRLVRIAAAYRDRKPDTFDDVWCVVDVDQFDIEAALTEARRCRINLAVSNPCFELWLLLHHADCRSHCTGYADVAARLKKHVPAYDKARLDFADYAPGVGEAVKRARDLKPTGVRHRDNPSTSVWRLVESITDQL